MAKRDKDRLYYEVTKEKPYGIFQMLLVGGSAGSVLTFLIVSLIGAYEGTDMDSLVLAFLLSSFLGFLIGVGVMWLVITRVEKHIPLSTLIMGPNLSGASADTTPAPPAVNHGPTSTIPEQDETVLGEEENKGKSVDFVFPELSPDK